MEHRMTESGNPCKAIAPNSPNGDGAFRHLLARGAVQPRRLTRDDRPFMSAPRSGPRASGAVDVMSTADFGLVLNTLLPSGRTKKGRTPRH
jgi:hypothetical protein